MNRYFRHIRPNPTRPIEVRKFDSTQPMVEPNTWPSLSQVPKVLSAVGWNRRLRRTSLCKAASSIQHRRSNGLKRACGKEWAIVLITQISHCTGLPPRHSIKGRRDDICIMVTVWLISSNYFICEMLTVTLLITHLPSECRRMPETTRCQTLRGCSKLRRK